ncbi:hypothetical protein Arth_3651 [Arthrobacter sp. FB24]|uniref:hypothetical protein n=1 Tax=Arthrobacter sp. (strain FB24) TaxID=290399 RepID=UPI00005278FF|nr:hypothetical protein [Arthrobacter sp. FB24]ABK05026.1 hypothetical protein Arth_3651 [Arthrobacter sp. FB24]
MVKMGDPLGEQRVIFGGPATVPPVVRASTAFWLASALVAGVLPVVLEFAGAGTGPSTPIWAVIALAVPLVALQVWGAFRLLAGVRWVRTVLTVIAVLSAAGAPFDLSLVVVTGLALTLAGAVLMWLPPANAFFRGEHQPAGAPH